MKKGFLIRAGGFLMAAALTGCGVSSATSFSADSMAYGGDYKNEASMENEMVMETEASAMPEDRISGGEMINQQMLENRKLIRTVHISLKVAGDLQQAVEETQSLLAAAGGYAENNSSYFGDYRSSVSIVMRVPKAESDGILEELKSRFKLLGMDDSVEDVTLNYTDVKSRLDVKQKTRDKYIEYLDKAETIEEIMAIEEKISEVTADIESYESQMRVMDNQIDYTTIYVELQSDEKAVEQSFGVGLKISFDISLKM